MEKIFLLHGLKGSPHGTKATFLRQYFPDIVVLDLPPALDQRMEAIQRKIDTPSYIVGSSLGGLCALLFAMEKPELVKGMVLLAPAVDLFDSSGVEERFLASAKKAFIPKSIPCFVIASSQDQLIPFESIKKMIQRSPDQKNISLISTKDDHCLNQSLPILLDSLNRLMGK
ncbi:MAG: alpha/beta hydrolase [Deltaproteobacteria bacterium]|nr:alpha/beta hydrolase [Deltaproteobacteria bacterium]